MGAYGGGPQGRIRGQDRIVPGAVHQIPGVLDPAVAEPDQVPGMVQLIAGDEDGLQPRQIAQVDEGQGVTLADRASLHQAGIGVPALIGQVVFAVGNDIVMDVQQLFLPGAVGHPGDDGGGDAVEGCRAALGISVVVLRVDGGDRRHGSVCGEDRFDIKELRAAQQHAVIAALAVVIGQVILAHVDGRGPILEPGDDIGADGVEGRLADGPVRPGQGPGELRRPEGQLQAEDLPRLLRGFRLRRRGGAREDGDDQEHGQKEAEQFFLHQAGSPFLLYSCLYFTPFFRFLQGPAEARSAARGKKRENPPRAHARDGSESLFFSRQRSRCRPQAAGPRRSHPWRTPGRSRRRGHSRYS